ncbi:MAG: protein kinase [Bdellovibrionales bacterium]|nr:protein kinase [Bdellovibrionales bacterium]
MQSGKKVQHDDAREIIKHILQGLSHLSKNRIIHRDLKPENIMFKKDKCWETAICDFGLATYAD